MAQSRVVTGRGTPQRAQALGTTRPAPPLGQGAGAGATPTGMLSDRAQAARGHCQGPHSCLSREPPSPLRPLERANWAPGQ